MKFIQYAFLSLLFFTACDSSENSTTENHNQSTENHNNKPAVTKVSAELTDTEKSHKIGDEISISLSFADSLTDKYCMVEYRDEIIDSLKTEQKEYIWNSSSAKVGNNALNFMLYEDGQKYQSSIQITLFPSKSPESLNYKVIKVFPHDRQAFTQGLFYKDGFLYEATGLRGESTVRKVELQTGEVIRSFAIPTEIFGEGITYYDDKIVQLSWNSGRGFVYRFTDFKLLEEFRYSGEGWGLEHNKGRLYMTDGSHTIRILSDQNYSLIETLEVYDDEGPVQYLNELEFIKGKLWANIYRHEKIAVINPATGEVEAYINLKRLLPMTDYTAQTDVLNGIAYDAEKDRIFVTGKKWPKLFEIEVY